MKTRSTRILALIATVCAAAGFGAAAYHPSHPSGANVTFTRDVAPIIYQNCAVCHRPGDMAPMSLLTYKEVRPWSKSIREVVAERRMPPWSADPHYGEFSNDRRLSPKQIETILAWVDGGAKEGDPKDLPSLPKFPEGWRMGQPDVVLTMTEDASIPAEGVVPYKYYVVPTDFTEDKYVQFAEIKRGDPRAVHHVIISVREPGQGPLPPAGEFRSRTERVNPERQGAESERQSGARGPNDPQRPRANQNPDGMLVGWAPGMEALNLRSGQAKLIKKGSVLIFQMHYTTFGEATKDRTGVGLRFARQPVEKRVITKGVSVDPRGLVIPAGAPNYESRSSFVFPEDSRIISFMPHMHLRGKDFEYKIVYPDGSSKVLLRVPKFDFNWQLQYLVKEPIAAPKGSRIECVAHHDNSAGNKFNPDPTKEVRWGDQTWEEMMIGWIDYTLDGQDLRQQAQVSEKVSEK